MFKFKIALQFLTRFPIHLPHMPSDQEMASSLVWYSTVGGLLGLVLAVIAQVLMPLPASITAALLLTVWITLTGALHLDGFADTLDAWVGGYGVRERTLELMKDPNCGPMAVVGLVLLLLLKYVALVQILEHQLHWGLIAVPWVARLMTAYLFVTTDYVRPQGLGAALSTYRFNTRHLIFFIVQGLLLLWLLGAMVLGMLLLSVMLLIGWRAIMVKALGGVTGDVVGAHIELTEVTVLLFIAINVFI